MYRRSSPGQLSFEDFYLPFGGKLSGDNRWVQLAALIPWDTFEVEYAKQFDATRGAPAKSFRIALGALIIKEKLGTSDEETVEQIRENPYLQYFLGFSEYQNEVPFDASMFVHFRKRISFELVGQVNEAVVAAMLIPTPEDSPTSDTTPPSPAQSDDEDDPPLPPNQGKLVLDATCAPADIRYPTDLGLLNEARVASEKIIDQLYEQVRDQFPVKPRTYRRKARKAYLAIAKKRRPGAKRVRKGVGQQLGYLQRNLGHIDALVAAGASLTVLSKRQYRTLLVIAEVFRQQQQVRVCIEGKFGQAKRRFSLARVMAKLASTAETTIAVTFLVMNLERRLCLLLLCFLGRLSACFSGLWWVFRALAAPSNEDWYSWSGDRLRWEMSSDSNLRVTEGCL
ncbi:MAG: transposase [Synechococcales bacterium]|nr:transposase [Synechococcales bacterium]